MAEKKQYDYRSFLRNELNLRQSRNSAYSLRAFARDLDIGASRLTEILNGKEGVSVDRAVHFADKLKLTDTDRSLFIDLVQSEHSRSQISRQAAKERVNNRLASFRSMNQEEEFLILSDWYNSAILELLNLPIEHDIGSFAIKLGIHPEFVQAVIEKMLRAGYLERVNNKWVPKEPHLSTLTDVPSQMVRGFHKQILAKAALALETKPLEERDYFSIVFSMNAQNMALAKKRISEFRNSLDQELSLNQSHDGVFCLSLQFFELTERNSAL